MEPTPDSVHGRLNEAMHIAGYAFERAWQKFEWLLEEDRWKRVGGGYEDVNEFLASIQLPRGASPEQRKAVAERIKELQPSASQRKIAGTLGVSEGTVRNDLAPPAKDYAPPPEKALRENSPDEPGAQHSAPTPEPAGDVVARKAAEKPHVFRNAGEQEWYTPPEIIEAARAFLGGIDLDPASSAIANGRIKASRYFTAQDDGLAQEWGGRVWMNPPYAAEFVGPFCDKLCKHLDDASVSSAAVLVNNATETTWFQNMARRAHSIVFPIKRVRFLDPDGNPGAPLQGQAILGFGGDVDRFYDSFSGFGFVVLVQ